MTPATPGDRNQQWSLTGKYERTAETAEIDAEAVRLRAQRLSYDDIAKRLGWAHRSSAKRAVARGLAAIPRDSAAELLMIENLALDNIDQALDTVIITPWPLAQVGRVVLHPGTGAPLTDPAPVLKALELRLKSAERRSKLNGHDAPRQSVRWDISVIEAEIERLKNEIAASGGDVGAGIDDDQDVSRPVPIRGEVLPPDQPGTAP